MNFTEIAKEVSRKGIQANSNLDQFEENLRLAGFDFDQTERIYILRALVWQDWCYTNGLSSELMELEATFPLPNRELGLSMSEELKTRVESGNGGKVVPYPALQESIQNDSESIGKPSASVSSGGTDVSS